MKIAYLRVSTVEQNLERQVKALEVYKIDKWFSEKVSGKNTDRPKLKEMLEFVREGDTVYVMDWSRLSRSTVDLLRIIEGLAHKKVKLVSIKENFDTSTPTGRLMLNLIASINEFERQNLLERQREGIEIAKNQGKYIGRKPNKYNEEQLRAIITGIANKTITVTEASRRLGVTRATVYNILKKKGS
ncbi:MAG: recombinase family protein [Ruminococcus sp.]|nr:recombinase family protein [Ruminococcus sp.]